MVIELRDDGKTLLRLACDERDWCRLTLEISLTCRREVGAENKDVLVDRLHEVLAGKWGPVIGQIEGLNVSWVTTLSQCHNTIYAADLDGCLELFFQDAAGGLTDRIRLSPLVRARWKHQLDAIRIKRS
jgi:hypothetical protein